jgi:hypothetical protein
MNYTQTPNELRIKPDEIIIKDLVIALENCPARTTDFEWTEEFKYSFKCNLGEFYFYTPEPVNIAHTTWIQAVENWLLPYLGLGGLCDH